MSLPNGGGQWPPALAQNVLESMGVWDAWYRGNPATLTAVYRRAASQRRDGVLRSVARWFWGSSPGTTDEPRTRVHVPVAADVCQSSADMLFADPPSLESDDARAQLQLEQYVSDGLVGELSSGAELGAALGGTFLRATWDPELQGRSFLSVVDADSALPVFRWGRLMSVTFWWTLTTGSGTVLRHLEEHSTVGGIGVVEHALYEGTSDLLGRRIPLAEHPSTASLVVDAESRVSTLTPGLAVSYVPNIRPQRSWRKDPFGKSLGRSDLDEAEPLMDALDETYSSLLQDIRLGKGRIIVPEYMLQMNKPGSGVNWDADREVYHALNVPPSESMLPVVTKFDVPVERYLMASKQLVRDILRTCGYSAQSFGEELESTATATEVVSRDRRTSSTRDSKIRFWKPSIQVMLTKMLSIDREVFRMPVDPEGVSVKFPDSVQETPLQLARTAQAMAAAQSASAYTRVRVLHPDWSEEQVDEEVARIYSETGVGLAV